MTKTMSVLLFVAVAYLGLGSLSTGSAWMTSPFNGLTERELHEKLIDLGRQSIQNPLGNDTTTNLLLIKCIASDEDYNTLNEEQQAILFQAACEGDAVASFLAGDYLSWHINTFDKMTMLERARYNQLLLLYRENKGLSPTEQLELEKLAHKQYGEYDFYKAIVSERNVIHETAFDIHEILATKIKGLQHVYPTFMTTRSNGIMVATGRERINRGQKGVPYGDDYRLYLILGMNEIDFEDTYNFGTKARQAYRDLMDTLGFEKKHLAFFEKVRKENPDATWFQLEWLLLDGFYQEFGSLSDPERLSHLFAREIVTRHGWHGTYYKYLLPVSLAPKLRYLKEYLATHKDDPLTLEDILYIDRNAPEMYRHVLGGGLGFKDMQDIKNLLAEFAIPQELADFVETQQRQFLESKAMSHQAIQNYVDEENIRFEGDPTVKEFFDAVSQSDETYTLSPNLPQWEVYIPVHLARHDYLQGLVHRQFLHHESENDIAL